MAGEFPEWTMLHEEGQYYTTFSCIYTLQRPTRAYWSDKSRSAWDMGVCKLLKLVPKSFYQLVQSKKRWSRTDVTARLCIRCMCARLSVLDSWICCLLIFVALQTHPRHLHHRFTEVLLRWTLPSFWLRHSHYRPFVVCKKATTSKVMSYLFSSQLKEFEIVYLCFVSCSSSIHHSMIFRRTFRYIALITIVRLLFPKRQLDRKLWVVSYA